MKTKTLAALALVAALGASPAWAAEVVSSNIVGYQKVSIRSGLTIVGAPFVDVGGSGEGLSIQAITPSDTENSGGISGLRIWAGTAYDDYFYYPEDQFGVGEDEIPGWGDINQEEAGTVIPPGTGFWIQSDSTEVLTVAGEVGSRNTVTVRSGLTLVCNPLPMDINIQNIVPSDTENSGGISGLRLWNGTAYVDYFYYPEDQFGVGENEIPGWGDINQEEVSVSIPSGTGFWIQSDKTETLTFNNSL